jgi:hypothetical protein
MDGVEHERADFGGHLGARLCQHIEEVEGRFRRGLAGDLRETGFGNADCSEGVVSRS